MEIKEPKFPQEQSEVVVDPVRDAQGEHATQADVERFRKDMQASIEGFRQDMQAGIEGLRKDVQAGMAGLAAQLDESLRVKLESLCLVGIIFLAMGTALLCMLLIVVLFA